MKEKIMNTNMMKKLINISILIFIIAIFTDCNSVFKNKNKESYKTTSDAKVNGKFHIDEKTFEIVEDINKTNFRYVEESTNKTNLNESEDNLNVEEGEITKTNKDGSITTVKGKGISTNSKSKQYLTEETLRKELNLAKDEFSKKIDSATKKIDSTYNAKYNTEVNNKITEVEKKAMRFPIAIIIGIFILIIAYVFAKKYKLL